MVVCTYNRSNYLHKILNILLKTTLKCRLYTVSWANDVDSLKYILISTKLYKPRLWFQAELSAFFYYWNQKTNSELIKNKRPIIFSITVVLGFGEYQSLSDTNGQGKLSNSFGGIFGTSKWKLRRVWDANPDSSSDWLKLSKYTSFVIWASDYRL